MNKQEIKVTPFSRIKDFFTDRAKLFLSGKTFEGVHPDENPFVEEDFPKIEEPMYREKGSTYLQYDEIGLQ